MRKNTWIVAMTGLLCVCAFSMIGCVQRTCGEGTVRFGDECRPETELVCGAGTVLVDGECRPESEVACGEGTVLMEGECVPEDEIVCGAGTVLIEGECRPESETVCGDGTVLVEGECQPEIAACGNGTVLSEGTCVPWIDVVEADQMEAAEPNDPSLAGTAGELTLPAEGADPVVLGGVIDTPTDPFETGFVEADFDVWAFTATAGTRIAIEGWSDGLFNVAFEIRGVDMDVNDAIAWSGLTVSSAENQRDIVIPVSGTYQLSVSDAANFDARMTHLTVGGPEMQYFVAVSVITNPDPAALTLGSAVSGDITDIDRYSVSATAGTMMEVNLPTWSGHFSGKIIAQRADTSVLGTWGGHGSFISGESVFFVMPEGDVIITVDYVGENNLFAPETEYSIVVREAENIVDATPGETQSFDLESPFVQFVRVEAEAAGTVINAELLDFGDSMQPVIMITDDQLLPLAESWPTCYDGSWTTSCYYWEDTFTVDGPDPVRFLAETAGTYYVRVFDSVFADGGDEHTFDLLVTTSSSMVEVEPNNDVSAAQSVPLASDAPTVVSANIVDATDFDWYEITIPAGGGTLTSETGPGTPGAETYMWLYAADGTTVLAENEDIDSWAWNFFSRIEYEVEGETTYYVVVGCTVQTESCVPDADYMLMLSL